MDFYSRMVAFLKVVLPLIALAILATLFLLSRGVQFDTQIPFAEADLAERTRDQQITGPFFSGTTAAGDEIIVNASIARPGGPNAPAEATDVKARLKAADGGEFDLTADLASVDMKSDIATFSGDVLIVTNTGLEIRTDVLETALSGMSGSTPGTVAARTPFGELDAGQMEFSARKDQETGTDPLHVLFKQGVKLIYDPKQSE